MTNKLLFFLSFVMLSSFSGLLAQEEPFTTVDISQPIGLGTFSFQATSDFNFWGWYSDAQAYNSLLFNIGFSKRLELSISWVLARNLPRTINSITPPYLKPFGMFWVNNYLKINIIDGTRKPLGLSTAINIPFPFSSIVFVGAYPAIFIRLIIDKQLSRHYATINVDMHLSESLYWVSRFGYTYSLKQKNPLLSLGLEGYVFYDVIRPKQYFLVGGGPVFNFEYTKQNFLYFFTISLTPELHQYYAIYYNRFTNSWDKFDVSYPGGAIRITTGIKFH